MKERWVKLICVKEMWVKADRDWIELDISFFFIVKRIGGFD